MRKGDSEGVTVNYTFSFKCNGPTKGWREFIGNALRTLAQKVDGRDSFGVHLESLPPLTGRERREVVLAGLNHMGRIQEQIVRLKATDSAMKENHPELFEKD